VFLVLLVMLLMLVAYEVQGYHFTTYEFNVHQPIYLTPCTPVTHTLTNLYRSGGN